MMFKCLKLKSLAQLLSLFVVFVLSQNHDTEENTLKINENEVSQWAEAIGVQLWNIGTEVTKLDVIKERYKEMNATVQPTDGNDILKTIVVRMNKLIKEKVDAVMRIKNATVKAESQFTSLNKPKKQLSYRNSKFSAISLRDPTIKIGTDYKSTAPNEFAFTEMTLSTDSHFENILVNTSYSSVHVPTNIFDRWDKVIEPIYWSEELDTVFIENYEKDPSLMWQYFASTSGFLRHFPAFHWSMYPDRYDCRKRIWYIQAATCSKEVIVLIDNSGTMYGMRNTIAQLTVDSLLQTFSNNDYVNIFRLEGDNVTCLVPCFNDTLMQATPENVAQFKKSLYAMCPHDKVNFTKGFLKAFHMLHEFMKNKPEQAERRNQAIFLLTDMLPSQYEMLIIRKEYERIYRNTGIQVELFIYFIGKDIPEIRVVQWEKCLRNGSIVHVRTMDEVPEDVLKYLPVIARSQNEKTEYRPISWTHVFLDIKKEKGKYMNESHDELDEANEEEHPEYGELSKPRIMTSVTTPVYSEKSSRNSTPGKEEMIGVAAIDVPVSDFEKLTIPHKIGVNGYAFIVTNNGYLLFHPDLTPVKDGTFRENFNSVDLTEVEFYDDSENEPRKPNENIVELRRRMVNQEVGNMSDMAIKFHYDDQKRVGSELRNYFFAPLKCSPFTLGLALPRGYGNYWIKTADEIEISKIKEENYSNYFAGDWNVHPKWTYCDFRDREKYDYRSPKDKLLKFLEMIFRNSSNFEWYDEHPGEDTENLNFTDSFDSCFAKDTTQKPTRNYFCDRELMGLLFFDAKLTHEEFSKDISETEKSFWKTNRIQVKFVSTQSGLTRWKYSPYDNVGNNDFGEVNNKALDEVWYKSAVLLHQLKSQNFVFSVPRHRGNVSEKYVTASHAIFYNDGENEAPGVVVGFEMAYQTIKEVVENSSKCGKTHIQNSGSFDCYMIDANGFVVYSTKEEHLQRFFGEIEGAVMEQMISLNIFRKLSMYDYQAFSDISESISESHTNSSSQALTPFNLFNRMNWIAKWLVSKILWTIIELSFWPYVDSSSSCSDSEPAYRDMSEEGSPSCRKLPKKYSDVCKTREVPSHIGKGDEDKSKSKKVPVDKQFFLYLYTNLSARGYKTDKNRLEENCSRPFYANRVINTNLILVAVFPGVQSCYKNLNVNQHVIKYNSNYSEIPACNKKGINSYPRKKLRGCSDKILENRSTVETCVSKQNVSTEINFAALVGLICCALWCMKT